MPERAADVGRAQKQERKRGNVFLNIPYDQKFLSLYLAYISGISAFGLVPRATLELPGGERRLDRILALIAECASSVHDLSRVEIDRHPPFWTPRFNMPFELGLCVAWHRFQDNSHMWVVCESTRHRVGKSLSDLAGTDVYIHHSTVPGVFRELSNAFVRQRRQPSVQQMEEIYGVVRKGLRRILRQRGSTDPFTASVFRDLCVAASRAADKLVS